MSALVTPEEVKAYVRARVRQCWKPGRGVGRYSFVPGGPQAVAASCDAVLVLYVTDQSPADADLRRKWSDYLNGFQDPQTGWYISHDMSDNYAGKGRMPAWLFGMAIRALNALGAQPRHPLSFLDEWARRERLRQ